MLDGKVHVKHGRLKKKKKRRIEAFEMWRSKWIQKIKLTISHLQSSVDYYILKKF